jgi:hypothetical protein
MPNRRTLLATSGAVALTLFAGGAAIAANLGILDSAKHSPIGTLSPVAVRSAPTTTATTEAPKVETVYVDEYVQDPAPAQVARTTYTPPATAAVPATSPAPSESVPPASDDTPHIDDHDSEDHETEDHAGEDHETEDHHDDHGEVPGAEDDD